MKAHIPLSADFLFRGAFYAAERGGTLLHDAVRLYKLRRFESATVLGVYSREEVGRSRILLEHRQRFLRGEAVRSDGKFRKLSVNHHPKLEASQFFVNVEPPKRKLRELKEEEIGRPKYYPEDAPFYAEWARRVEKARAERAQILQKQRLRAIHVDLSDDGAGWNRPCEIHPGWVSMLLDHLCMDYLQLYQELSGREDQSVAAALREWPDHPTLPWPMYVPWHEQGNGARAGPISNPG